MAKERGQVLIIEPNNELSFMGPFTKSVSTVMKLTNPSDKRVLFKIKTTAPRKYCVKPNSGVLDPSQQMEIIVSLQPFVFDPQEKNRHKFMVQSMFAPDGEINADALWKDADDLVLMDSKLKCSFLLPHESSEDEKDAAEFKFSSNASPGVEETAAKKTTAEMRKLVEETSSLRQENIELKEELARNKMQANMKKTSGRPGGFTMTTVAATPPDTTSINQTYIYAAVVILLLGMIIGKWIL